MRVGNRKKISTKRKSPRTQEITGSKKKRQEAFRNEVILWIALAVAIILFVSNLGFGGVVGGMVSDFFFGVFGLLSYIVPIGRPRTAFLISNKKNQIAGIKFFSGIMLAVFLCLFFQLVLDREDVYSAKAAFVYARANKSGRGFIGRSVRWIALPEHRTHRYICADVAVLIISFVLLTEKLPAVPDEKKRTGYLRQCERRCGKTPRTA